MTPDSDTPTQEIPSSSAPTKLSPAERGVGSATVLPPRVAARPNRPSGLHLWLHRLLVLLFVFLCAGAGVLLLVVPWTPQWTDNYLLLRWPGLRTVVSNGFIRGLCSGLGLLDIWIGFREAVRYHEVQQF